MPLYPKLSNQAIVRSKGFDPYIPSPLGQAFNRRMSEQQQADYKAQDMKLSPLDRAVAGLESAMMMGSMLFEAVQQAPKLLQGEDAYATAIGNRVYQPRFQPEKSAEYIGNVIDLMDKAQTEYKLPPILPEVAGFTPLMQAANRQVKQGVNKAATNAGMALERSLDKPVTNIMNRGGFGAQMLGSFDTQPARVTKPKAGKLSSNAPQENALLLAQQRAALPIEKGGLGLPPNNTAEQRAIAMGFDKDTYHGSFRDIEKLDPSSGSTESHAGKGIYSTDSPEDASQNYASIYGPDVRNRVERGMEVRDKDWRKTYRRMQDETLTPRQQDILLRNTVDSDNLGVVYPLKVRSNKSIHLDAPEKDPVTIGPFEHYDEAADTYVDTPHTAKFNEALDEFREIGGDANPVYETVQDYGGAIPARDVFNAVKKTGNESGLYDPYTGDIVSGGVAAGDFMKHFGIDEIRHTPSFNSQELNIGKEHTISFDPDNVRSRFAAFDPFRRSAAVAAAMGVAAPNLLAKEKKSDEKKADGGSVHVSDNPDTMMTEMEDRKYQVGGIVDIAARAARAAKAAQMKQAMKASEALAKIEGKRLNITQADRTKVGQGFLGGPGFSGLQHQEGPHKDVGAVWGVKNVGTAKTMLGGFQDPLGKEYFTTMIGSPTQHQSNQMVFDKLYNQFKSEAKKGNLDPELRDKINARLAASVDKDGKPIFPSDIDILDKNFKKQATTFDQRAVTGNVLGGVGVGGKKGQIFDYDKIIRDTTDPFLLDAPSGSMGYRLWTPSGEVIERPDLHPAFPAIATGEDLGVEFNPAAQDILMEPWVQNIRETKGRNPGYMDWTRGRPPSVEVTEDILTNLQKSGNKDGGLIKVKRKAKAIKKVAEVKKAQGGEITGDDLILTERPL